MRKDSGFQLVDFVYASWIILFVASFLQIFFFFQMDNIIVVCMIVVVWLLTSYLFFRPSIIYNYTLSTFIIIGFVSTQLYFPLIFTLLEFNPVVFNLEMPYQVFCHLFLIFTVLIIAHFFYRLLAISTVPNIRYVLSKTGFYKPPSNSQLWMMGILGLFSMFYVYYYSPSVGRQTTSVLDKLIQGFIPFTYAPFFIPFSRMIGRQFKSQNYLPLKLVVFFIALIIVSIGSNSRGMFMSIFISIGCAFVLGYGLNLIRPKIITIKNVLVGFIVFWIITGPFADLGTAIVLVRGERDEIDRTELVFLTLEAYQDKDAIRQYRLSGTENQQEWSEYYVSNIFLSRFCNLKYNDLSLIQAFKYDNYDNFFYEYTINHFWSTVPEPFLSIFSPNFDKKSNNSMSFGDYLYYLAGADISSLGSFRTGDMAGTGLAAFGWWYLAILGFSILPTFMIVDSFYIYKKDLNTKKWNITFSLCSLLILNSIFQFLPKESVIIIPEYLLRGWIQIIFTYLVIYYFTYFINRIFRIG